MVIYSRERPNRSHLKRGRQKGWKIKKRINPVPLIFCKLRGFLVITPKQFYKI